MNSDLRSILWSHDLDSGKCFDAFVSNTDRNWWYSFGTSSSKVFSVFGSSLWARLCDIDVLALIVISESIWISWFRGSSFSGSDVIISPWRYAAIRSPSDSSSSSSVSGTATGVPWGSSCCELLNQRQWVWQRSLPSPGYSIWNPCGIHGIHQEFHMDSMEWMLAESPANFSFHGHHGFHVEWGWND